MVAQLAALRAGLVVVPVNPSYTERELAHVVGDVRPAAAIVDDPDRAAVVVRAASGAIVVATPDLQVVGSVGERSVGALGRQRRAEGR